VLLCVAVCCSVLQCVAVCCSVLQCVAVCCSVLQCVAVCSVLQCAAVRCSVLQCNTHHEQINPRTSNNSESPHYNTLQHTATPCNAQLHHHIQINPRTHSNSESPHCNTLQHMGTHGNTLQRTAPPTVYKSTHEHAATNAWPPPRTETRSLHNVINTCCSVLHCAAVCCSVLQRAAVCCSVLQYVAVCCSVLQQLTRDLLSRTESTLTTQCRQHMSRCVAV